MAKLVKLTDDVFNGKHPHGIQEGYTKEVDNITPPLPVIGERYYFGYFSSSLVTELLSSNEFGFTFKTKNSTYKVEY